MNKGNRNGIFVTGTDTGIGKTIVSAALLGSLRSAGIDAAYMKPIQTGCKKRGKKLVAPDLEFVCAHAGIRPSKKELGLMAPYCLRKPCSPHLAAALEKRSVRIAKILKAFYELSLRHEFIVVEGAGGILVPISRKHTMLDLMKSLNLPVVVVARPGLGTINHTLLTLRELGRAGLEVAGVVINHAVTAPKTGIEKNNLETIERLGNTRVIAELPFLRSLDRPLRRHSARPARGGFQRQAPFGF